MPVLAHVPIKRTVRKCSVDQTLSDLANGRIAPGENRKLLRGNDSVFRIARNVNDLAALLADGLGQISKWHVRLIEARSTLAFHHQFAEHLQALIAQFQAWSRDVRLFVLDNICRLRIVVFDAENDALEPGCSGLCLFFASYL